MSLILWVLGLLKRCSRSARHLLRSAPRTRAVKTDSQTNMFPTPPRCLPMAAAQDKHGPKAHGISKFGKKTLQTFPKQDEHISLHPHPAKGLNRSSYCVGIQRLETTAFRSEADSAKRRHSGKLTSLTPAASMSASRNTLIA